MPDPGAAVLLPPPPDGRRFSASRRVRLADVSPGGRLRLDSVARYLQDVSSDDTADARLDDDLAWVVRRLLVDVDVAPTFREVVALDTWCSGTGRSWAERRVSVAGEAGGRVEAAVLWVHVDAGSGRPRRLGEAFFARYGGSGVARKVAARLPLAPAPPDAGVSVRPWAVRVADLDVLGHVNNAAYLAVVEEELARRRELRPPFRVEVDYRAPIERGDHVEAVVRDGEGSLDLWLRPPGDATTGTTYAVARVTALAGPRAASGPADGES